MTRPTTAAENRGINEIYVHLGRTGPHDRMLCRYVRVRFSGNVFLVQMFIKPAIYVGTTTNNVQLL